MNLSQQFGVSSAVNSAAQSMKLLLWAVCDRIEVVGSLRRKEREPKDVDILLIPRYMVRPRPQRNLFPSPEEPDTERVNLAWDRLEADLRTPEFPFKRHPGFFQKCGYGCQGGGCEHCGHTGEFLVRAAPWGDKQRKLRYIGKVDVDLFVAAPDAWGAQKLIRTGPAEYSKRWVTALKRIGLEMSGGFVRRRDSRVVPCRDENEAHRLVGWPFALPRMR